MRGYAPLAVVLASLSLLAYVVYSRLVVPAPVSAQSAGSVATLPNADRPPEPAPLDYRAHRRISKDVVLRIDQPLAAKLGETQADITIMTKGGQSITVTRWAVQAADRLLIQEITGADPEDEYFFLVIKWGDGTKTLHPIHETVQRNAGTPGV